MLRPYLSRSIGELEMLVQGHRQEPAVLADVTAELRLRKTERARKLLERILAQGLRSPGTASIARAAPDLFDNVVRLASVRAVGAGGGKPRWAEVDLPQVQQWAPDPGDRHPDAEGRRIAGNFDALREKLLQLSRSNPMLNYRPLSRSRRHIAFVDEALETVYARLVSDDDELDIVPLREPADIPADERNEEFEEQLAYLKATDIEYQAALQGTEANARDDDFEVLKLERALRDKLRAQLGMPPRAKRKELNIVSHARENGIDPGYEIGKPGGARRGVRLQSMMLGENLQSRMGAIHDLARMSEQEMGFSTLFLAFGFLEWYDATASAEPSFAPLVMLPVKLTAHPVGGKKTYTLKATSEDATGNVTLAKKLQQFSRALADFDPDDGGEDPIGDYLESVRRAVEGLPNWKVRRFLVLGHFSFGRLAMYQDLDPTAWGDLAGHPLAAGVLRGALTVDREGAPTGIPEDYDIDSPEIERDAPILVHDADASQHSAIVDVMRRNDLVVSGPPGTGKSQTITNIIANALARDANTTVLFVSEKMAALEVVKRRLETAGLGEFCLELHADKSSPKAVIDSLKRRAAVDAEPNDDTNASRTAWNNARRSINAYLEDLHTKDPGGAPAFDLIWQSLELNRANGAIAPGLADVALSPGLLDDVEKQLWLLDEMEKAAGVTKAFEERHGPLADSPWRGFPMAATPGQTADVVASLTRLRTALERAAPIAREAEAMGLDFDVAEWIADMRAFKEPASMADVECILAIDPKSGAVAVSEVRRLREIEEELTADPLYLDLRGERLAAVERFAALARGAHDLSPADALRRAREDVADADNRLAQIEASHGLRAALGLEESAPLSILPAAWFAAVVAAAIPADFRDLLRWDSGGDDVAFQSAFAEWTRLREAERDFEQAFERYPPKGKLNAALLREHANLLDESLVGLKFWKREALATAKATVDGLGIGGDQADGLKRLANHVTAVDAFVSDPANAMLAGPHWNGLATPFDRLAQALRLRNLVREKLAPYVGGATVAQRLLTSDVAALQSVAEAQALAREKLPEARRFVVDTTPIRDAGREAKSAKATAQALLASKDADAVSGIEAPLSKLLGLARLAADREALARRIDTLPGGRAVSDVVRVSRDTDLVSSQFHWIGAVRSARLPEPVKGRLTSDTAIDNLRALRDLADRVDGARRGEIAERDSSERAHGLRLPDTPREDILGRIDAALARRAELRDYLAILSARRALVEHGLSTFIDAMDGTGASAAAYPAVFKQMLFRQRADRAYRASTTLQSVSGAILDASRRTFRTQDSLKIRQDRFKVRQEVLKRRGRPGSALGRRREWTEMALVHHEMQKQRGYLNVRALLRQAGHSIWALKPCFMMSPMTVSKFLPRDAKFDLVIIDEASQMRPEDALGALLRARQIVVVGDAKQLPPTSFFDRAMDDVESDDDNDEADEQVEESILEACTKSFDRVRRLKWHYRSRCESLIDFSNEHFYERSLITFPMARPGSFSIDLVRVDGEYQAGVNAAEAQRICEEAIALMERLADVDGPDFGTMAIVAVNQKQREAILKQFETASGNASVLRYMERCEALGEPFVVKNLENVQGDERDFILISMTYGPGPKKKVVDQRFGPINKSQGHRRLNVLFSRARRRIGLFTSMSAKDVRPTETSKQGVRILKAYLEYAERAGAPAGRETGRGHKSPFEREVAERLRARGFEVHKQVGVSHFRIDLAVKHREHPLVYVAGIECDGAAYHSSRSARDRDRLREDVLADLGWKLVRVWSTDWFADPEQETERLIRDRTP